MWQRLIIFLVFPKLSIFNLLLTDLRKQIFLSVYKFLYKLAFSMKCLSLWIGFLYEMSFSMNWLSLWIDFLCEMPFCVKCLSLWISFLYEMPFSIKCHYLLNIQSFKCPMKNVLCLCFFIYKISFVKCFPTKISYHHYVIINAVD